MSAPWRVALALAWLAAGLLLGLVAGFLQAARTTILGITWPWGLLVALGLLLVLIRASIEAQRSRGAGWLVFAGWLAMTLALAIESPWGDLVISSGGRQLAYLFGGVVVGSAAATVRPLFGGARV